MDGSYQLALVNNQYILKFIGQIRYTASPVLHNFIHQLQEESDKKEVAVDLSQTQYLDSTNLGLLAKIARYCLQTFHHKLTVITTDKSITELLHNVGFDALCQFISSPLEYVEEVSELQKNASIDTASLGKIMYQAHKTLMDMNEKNRIEFQDAVALLRQASE